MPITWESRRRRPGPRSNSSAYANVNSDADAATEINANPNDNANAITDANASTAENTLMAESRNVSASTSTCPWLSSLNCNDLQISEHDWRRWASHSHIIDHTQIDAGTTSLNPSQNEGGSALTANVDGNASVSGDLLSSPPLYNYVIGTGSDLFESSSRSDSSNTIATITSTAATTVDENDPDAGIARLSQLSTRLYPLHRSSCALAETVGRLGQSKDRNSARHGPLIDDTTFKSVAAWLVHGSSKTNMVFRTDRRDLGLETATMGDILLDAFSASYHLLDILCGLQFDFMPTISFQTPSLSRPNSSFAAEAHLDFGARNTPQSMSRPEENSANLERSQESSSYARSIGQYSTIVVRHLVIACHTLLLNIYVAVLTALQHEANKSPCPYVRNSDEARTPAAALDDIRLVTVVQLCSFLIKRQYQAVDLYISAQSPQPAPQPNQLSGAYPSSLPLSTNADRQVMSDLETEVQRRLAQLRETLFI